jgi:hypothetical protein
MAAFRRNFDSSSWLFFVEYGKRAFVSARRFWGSGPRTLSIIVIVSAGVPVNCGSSGWYVSISAIMHPMAKWSIVFVQ